MSFKTLLVRIFFCLLAFVALDYLCGIMFRSLYQVAGDKFAKEVYERDNMTADVLLMGSSKCAHGYMSECFKDTLGLETYNCGQRGNGIIYTYGRLKTIYARYTPKIVVVDLIQDFDIQTNDNTRYLYYLKDDYGKYDALNELFADCDRTLPYKMVLSSYRYNSMICDLLLNTALRNRGRFQADGFMPIDGEVGKLKIEIPKANRVINSDPVKIKYLNKLVEERPEGCQLLFVLSPSYELPNPDFVKVVSEIANKYSIFLLNYSEDSRFLGKGDLYADGAHLNVKGAKLFSSTVAHDIKNLLNK